MTVKYLTEEPYETRVSSENTEDEEDGQRVCRLEGNHVLIDKRHS